MSTEQMLIAIRKASLIVAENLSQPRDAEEISNRLIPVLDNEASRRD